jgi:DNA-binding NarL/FixJ family response regulator
MIARSRPPNGLSPVGPILVVDGHQLVGTALVVGLQAAGEHAWFCAPQVLHKALRSTAVHAAGIVLLELDLGRDDHGKWINGTDWIPVFVDAGWRVIVLTASTEPSRIGRALAAGGSTWVCKQEPFAALVEAVRRTRTGHDRAARQHHSEMIALHQTRLDRLEARDAYLRRLTPREGQILSLLASGHRPKEIAENFVVSLSTVRSQNNSIYTKLDVHSQLEAVAMHSRGGRDDGDWATEMSG